MVTRPGNHVSGTQSTRGDLCRRTPTDSNPSRIKTSPPKYERQTRSADVDADPQYGSSDACFWAGVSGCALCVQHMSAQMMSVASYLLCLRCNPVIL